MSAKAPLHVVAAVLRDAAGRVLLSRRPDHLHQGGLWEFPGGKVEPGEGADAALCRELREELGIVAAGSRPLLLVDHAYHDLRVLLDVREVDRWSGEPHPHEGQALRWADATTLDPAEFPAADRPVLTALRLPPTYVISDEAGSAAAWLRRLERVLARGARLLQLRAKRLPAAELAALAGSAAARCRAAGATLLVNAEPAQAAAWGAHGVHLSSARLAGFTRAGLPPGFLVAASCHDAAELALARARGVDFVTLSPLRPTASHPGQPALGWEGFARLAPSSGLPVYALGGCAVDDLDAVRRAGGYGVAGIGGFWGRDAADAPPR
ncbi:MAG TPA: Nudix family hydrolase [Gammaproteobacteria bacterium]